MAMQNNTIMKYLKKTNMKKKELEIALTTYTVAYKKGYTQCQKDIVKELKEWIEITLSAKSKLGASDNVIEALLNVKYKIESLNNQD